MKNLAIIVTVLALLSGSSETIKADFVTGSLTASPSVIYAGDSTSLTLDLSYTPNSDSVTSYYDYFGGGYYYIYSGWSGYGYINSIQGTLNSGNGQSLSLNTSVGTSTYSVSTSFVYPSVSNYTATASGTISTYELFTYEYYTYLYNYSTGYYYYDGFTNDSYYVSNSFSFGENASIDVLPDVQATPAPTGLVLFLTGTVSFAAILGWRRGRQLIL